MSCRHAKALRGPVVSDRGLISRVPSREGQIHFLSANMTMDRFARNVPLIMLILATLSACDREDALPRPRPESIMPDMIISVRNRTDRDKAIVLTIGAREHALGVVRARSSRGFSVPSGAGRASSKLHLEARDRLFPLVRSDTFHFSSGEWVDWTLDATGRALVIRR
jgi:hypothetical protein